MKEDSEHRRDCLATMEPYRDPIRKACAIFLKHNRLCECAGCTDIVLRLAPSTHAALRWLDAFVDSVEDNAGAPSVVIAEARVKLALLRDASHDEPLIRVMAQALVDALDRVDAALQSSVETAAPTEDEERFCPTCGSSTWRNVHCGLPTVLPGDAHLYADPPSALQDDEPSHAHQAFTLHAREEAR